MAQDGPGRMDAASLREAALAHMLRYGGTGASLTRALDNRIHRWAEAMGAEEGADRTELATQAESWRVVARQVVESLTKLGAVNDAAFAESRARRLRRTGGSRRAVLAHLGAKGVESETAATAVPEDETAELAAALVFARRRRVGPFAAGEGRATDAMRVMAAFGRAGFGSAITRRALACERDEAEDIIRRAASGEPPADPFR
jgi:regulatory protein